jgi:hypothetical protein
MKDIKEVQVDDVMSVYSGRDGCCCCGCAGNHRYASKHVKVAGKYRGYKVRPEEVSDRSVKLTLNKLKKNADKVNHSVGYGSDFYSLVTGNRLNIVYLLPQ